jgi:hypothetical protein
MALPILKLAPGQRYSAKEATSWRADQQLTILQVGRDEKGDLWISYRIPGGPVMTAVASQIERAIAEGEMVPIYGSGQMARC